MLQHLHSVIVTFKFIAALLHWESKAFVFDFMIFLEWYCNNPKQIKEQIYVISKLFIYLICNITYFCYNFIDNCVITTGLAFVSEVLACFEKTFVFLKNPFDPNKHEVIYDDNRLQFFVKATADGSVLFFCSGILYPRRSFSSKA